MQTFLPYSDFRRTAAVLDPRRLGKQRVETLQILRALTFDDYGWRNHPAVTMWRGYTAALVTYGAAIAGAWQSAGFADTVLPQVLEFLGPDPLRSQAELARAGVLPRWIGDRRLHRSHQAALVRKDPAHYGTLFPNVDPELPYVWPEPVAAPQPSAAGVSAWVVRMDPDAVASARTLQVVALRPAPGERPDAPTGTGTRNTKRRRQLQTFVERIETGDRIAVPVGGHVVVGEVAGRYEWRTDLIEGLHHTRRVRWTGEVQRSDLLRPVYLQDPRVVFGVREEPGLAAVG